MESLRRASAAPCSSWGRSNLRGPSSVPFIDSCRSNLGPRSAEFQCQILLPLSGRAGLGLQALQLRSLDGKHNGGTTSRRAGEQRRDRDRRLVPQRGQDDKIDVGRSRWFSLELKEEDWPWVYSRGSQTSACHLDSRSTRRASRTETTVRRDLLGETHESSDSPDDHGQPWERYSPEQTDEHQVPCIRSAHGTGVIHEKDEPADGCRVGAS